MKSNELRIGNWINIYDDFNAKVTGMTNTNKAWFVKNPHNDDCAFNVHQIKPIPLTEEWLLKFGFIDDNKTNRKEYKLIFTYINWCLFGNTPESNYFRVYQETDKNKYHEDIRGYYLGEFQVYASLSFVITIKYVHQLQNLYFALTGKELNEKN